MGLFSKLFQSNEKNFVSPMTGKVVAMSDIPDPAFAQKMMAFSFSGYFTKEMNFLCTFFNMTCS